MIIKKYLIHIVFLKYNFAPCFEKDVEMVTQTFKQQLWEPAVVPEMSILIDK